MGQKKVIQITQNSFSSDKYHYSFKDECFEALKKLSCILWGVRERLLSKGKGTRMARAYSKHSKFSSNARYASAFVVTHSICKGFWHRRHKNLDV